VISITLPLRLTNPLNNAQGFSKGAVFKKSRERKAKRGAARMCTATHAREVKGWLAAGQRVEVTITRVSPRAFDSDGAVASAKSIRDGIADALGVNDNDARIEWKVTQQRGQPREYAVRITIEKAESR
jgi:hypothetical protein